ncbi:type VI secretion system-associated protein TagO [Paracoccus sp. P2]|uniref:type VI secretion system-associated protein TagO n=1 Tax=Paracoccus sp. P2 TaxID=3248840 RepID=UPI00391F9A4D
MLRFILLTAMLPTIAFAAEDPKTCHSRSTPTERLSCYDGLTGFESAAAPVEPDLGGEQWHVIIEGSDLEDRKDVYLIVMSSNKQGTGYGSSDNGSLLLRCMKNKTNVLINFASYTSDAQAVKYRLDDGPVKTIRMETLKGGEGLGVWSGGQSIPFIKGLLDKKKLVVAYESYSNADVEFSFDVSGLRGKLGPLAESCGWSF